MGAIASQITSLTIVYSIVYSDADQGKHQNPASLALCGEFIDFFTMPTLYYSIVQHMPGMKELMEII